ncbi:MAG: biosynthetic arginine decarboxylase [Desulfocapsa sp.]|nr:biosynthetic arginine decarboxylase [Desulfocapsa sp.]
MIKPYNVDSWGSGYFGVNERGHLCVLPDKRLDGPIIDFIQVIKEIQEQGIPLPTVIRFHDILRSQVQLLNTTFAEVISEHGYQGRFYGVYPIKVNQMREVVEEIIDAGHPFDHGLEAGSKSELLACLAYNENSASLTVLNGYKDEEYIRLALLGRKLGRKVIIVVEKFSEFDLIIRLSKEMQADPLIGIRTKLAVKGSGRWAGSSGDRAKFGLTCSEIVAGVELLRQNGMTNCLKLLHFHVGSQIPDIRIVKEAITEAGRIYVNLAQSGIAIDYFDVGGGLGVDYDGSRSTGDSSRNYTLREYAADIVSGLQQLCDETGVTHPHIVSESGRYITAHHSCVITNVISSLHQASNSCSTTVDEGEHILLTNMREAAESLNQTNCQEIFNDIQQYKDETIVAFRLGVICLVERAKVETLYWKIIGRIHIMLEKMDFIPEDLQQIEELKANQYLCNFSVFQSAADTWAISQILPIMPVMRLHEEPDVRCSLADITCDSDGKITRFIAKDGYDQTLLLHSLEPDEDYYIGLFLTGAYQDVMGDMHNLFGRLNEVHIYCDDDDPDDFYIEEVIKGTSAQQVLATMQYNPEIMARSIKKMIDHQIRQGSVLPREGVALIDFYESCLQGYTYLKM